MTRASERAQHRGSRRPRFSLAPFTPYTEAMPYCPGCGNAATDGQRFCSHCGRALPAPLADEPAATVLDLRAPAPTDDAAPTHTVREPRAQTPTARPTSTASPSTARRSRRWPVVLVGAIALVGVGVVSYALWWSRPSAPDTQPAAAASALGAEAVATLTTPPASAAQVLTPAAATPAATFDAGTSLPAPAPASTPHAAFKPPPPEPARGPESVHTLSPAGGVYAASGIEIRAPAGAVTRPTTLRIAPLLAAPMSPDRNLVVVSPVFDLQAGPGAFAQPVEVTIPYDAARLPTGRSEADLIGLLWTGRGYARVPPASLDRAARKVTLRLRHFSQPALGVLASPSRVRKQHPTYPFDVAVVDAHAPPNVEAFVDVVYASAEAFFRKLSAYSARGEPIATPPHALAGESKRLRLEVTDVATLGHRYPGGMIPSAITPSDALVQIDKRELPVTPVWDAIVHELFHAVLWTYVERSRFLGKGGHFSNLLAEMTATWATDLFVPAFPGYRLFDPERIYLDLTYDPFVDPAATDVRSAYQHGFLWHLVGRFGSAAVSRLLAFIPASASARQALDLTVREVSGGKTTLEQTFADFVLDVVFRGQIAGVPLRDAKRDAVHVVPGRVRALSFEAPLNGVATARISFDEAQPLSVPALVQLSLPDVAPGTPARRLTVESSHYGHAFVVAQTPAGQTLLGGGKKVLAELPAGTTGLWLIPWSTARGMSLTAQLLDASADAGLAAAFLPDDPVVPASPDVKSQVRRVAFTTKKDPITAATFDARLALFRRYFLSLAPNDRKALFGSGRFESVQQALAARGADAPAMLTRMFKTLTLILF